MNPTQARILLDAVCGDRLEALCTVAVALGLRPGEILDINVALTLDGCPAVARWLKWLPGRHAPSATLPR